jgi:4-diphosphocytidyl-2-C-methyl-D-erythritol kinase
VVTAPAKLNLGLAVVGRRPDGYHDLHTVFQAIDLADTVRLRRRPEPGVSLVVDGEVPVPAGEENLAVRAALRLGEGLQAHRGEGPWKTAGLEIHLTKRIPSGAGLGGGSSDAAAVLVGLEALWGARLPEPERLALALALGSDVPFFLIGGTARGEGRGEILTPLPAPPPAAWVLAIPPFAVATAKAYENLSRRLTSSVSNLRMLEAALLSGDFGAFTENIVNDLEVGVVRIQPRLARIKRELLSRGAAGVGLTGSGSVLFAVFRSQGTAEELLARGVPFQGVRVHRCSPVDYGAVVVSRPA